MVLARSHAERKVSKNRVETKERPDPERNCSKIAKAPGMRTPNRGAVWCSVWGTGIDEVLTSDSLTALRLAIDGRIGDGS
jgi:hypothetical protein